MLSHSDMMDVTVVLSVRDGLGKLSVTIAGGLDVASSVGSGGQSSLLVLTGDANDVGSVLETLMFAFSGLGEQGEIDVSVTDEFERVVSGVLAVEVDCSLEPAPELSAVLFRLRPIQLEFYFTRGVSVSDLSMNGLFPSSMILGASSEVTQPLANVIRVTASSDATFVGGDSILLNGSLIAACDGGSVLGEVNVTIPAPQGSDFVDIEAQLIGPSSVGTCTGDVVVSLDMIRGTYGRAVTVAWSADFNYTNSGSYIEFDPNGKFVLCTVFDLSEVL